MRNQKAAGVAKKVVLFLLRFLLKLCRFKPALKSM